MRKMLPFLAMQPCGFVLLLLTFLPLITHGQELIQHEGLQRARMYGNYSLQYYYIFVEIGTPPQRTTLITDTGSDITALACGDCEHCGKHLMHPFNKTLSSTLKKTPCDDACPRKYTCERENRDSCGYLIQYAEGSGLQGDFITDYFAFGDLRRKNKNFIYDFIGCHRYENKLFYTQLAEGIIGLGPLGSTVSVLRNYFNELTDINKVFGLCLSEQGGMMTLGDFDTSYCVDESDNVIIQILSDNTYIVKLKQMAIDEHVHVASNLMLVDSGSTLLIFPHEFKNFFYTVYSDFINSTFESDNDLAEAIKSLPSLTITFSNDATTSLPASNFINTQRSVEEHNRKVFPFKVEFDQTSQITLGIPFFINKQVSFDLGENKIVISDAICPSFREPEVEIKTDILFPVKSLILEKPDNFLKTITLVVGLGWVFLSGLFCVVFFPKFCNYGGLKTADAVEEVDLPISHIAIELQNGETFDFDQEQGHTLDTFDSSSEDSFSD